MAFVNELIPQEVKEKFTFPVQISPFDVSKPTLWKWTIDHERNVFLVLTKKEGGGYAGTHETKHYVLCWQGKQIFFSGTPNVILDSQKMQIKTWKIKTLTLPVEFRSQYAEVLALINEALDAMGWLYNRNSVKAVEVNFDLLADELGQQSGRGH